MAKLDCTEARGGARRVRRRVDDDLRKICGESDGDRFLQREKRVCCVCQRKTMCQSGRKVHVECVLFHWRVTVDRDMDIVKCSMGKREKRILFPGF